MTIRPHSETSATRFSDHRGTAVEGWCVGMGVKVLRTMTAFCALLVAVGGCGATEPDPPTTVVQSQPDPWTLPLEDRPPVFNPCEEITAEELESLGLEDVQVDPSVEKHNVSLDSHMCGWTGYPMSLMVAASWTTLEELAIQFSGRESTQIQYSGMAALKLRRSSGGSEPECTFAVETPDGTLTFSAVRAERPGVLPDNTFKACRELEPIVEATVLDVKENGNG